MEYGARGGSPWLELTYPQWKHTRTRNGRHGPRQWGRADETRGISPGDANGTRACDPRARNMSASGSYIPFRYERTVQTIREGRENIPSPESKWECLQTTKASVTIMYTTFSRCFGLAEVFIERDGPIEAWAIDRTEDGLSIWVGRIHVNASFTRKNRKTLLAVALGLAIYGAFVASGRNIGDNPLEVAGWAVFARKYTA